MLIQQQQKVSLQMKCEHFFLHSKLPATLLLDYFVDAHTTVLWQKITLT